MTNWIVGHTNRFKAAVTQRSISNWTSFFGTTDIGYFFAPDQIGDDPWNNTEGYWEKSPLKYAPNVETPLLIIHSMEDYRCWLPEALQFFTALKYLAKPSSSPSSRARTTTSAAQESRSTGLGGLNL